MSEDELQSSLDLTDSIIVTQWNLCIKWLALSGHSRLVATKILLKSFPKIIALASHLGLEIFLDAFTVKIVQDVHQFMRIAFNFWNPNKGEKTIGICLTAERFSWRQVSYRCQ